jgi:DNA-binding GntR family transcriptional regulator
VPVVAPQPLSTVSLAQEIAFRLQCDILDGRLALGERLAQDELCARFGVSRTPVREALQQLHAVNLVSLRPNRGAIVRVPTRREVLDVYELRCEVEGFAAQLAAERIDPVVIRELHQAQCDLEAIVGTVGTETLVASEAALTQDVGTINDTFHDAILKAAGNHALHDTTVRLRRFFPKDYVTRAIGDLDTLRTLNIDEHEQIVAEITSSDPRQARRAMHNHVAHAGEILITHLDQRRFWE